MNRLRSALLMPVWTVQLFGTAKSFRDNPLIGSALLNRLGLHAGRLVAAHALNRLRLGLLSPLAEPAQRRQFRDQGYVVIPNYLPAGEFAALERQVRQARGEVRECIQGDTLTHRILLDDEALATMPALGHLFARPGFEALLKYCAARLKRPLYYVQSIKNGYVEGPPDPQKTLHSDTFHPTMKAWFFIDAVPLDGGPFTYVPGSHRLTRARLGWEYERSCRAGSLSDGYSEKGSMRATPEDLKALGLPDPVRLAVEPNTLVVADTHGFHCRGQARPRTSRLEIWAYSRTNPFNPLPGFGFRFVSRLECRLAKLYWRWQDDRAAKRNTISSWHLVEREDARYGPGSGDKPLSGRRAKLARSPDQVW
jgi:hypothetical protein